MLTLKDYMRQVPFSATRQKNKGPDPSRFDPLNRFDKILSASEKGNTTPKSNTGKGLTILDYMANPVRALLVSSRMSSPNKIEATQGDGKTPSINEQVSKQFQLSDIKDKKSGSNDFSATGTSTETTVSTASARNRSVRQKIDRCIEEAAAKYRLPANLIRGVMQAESGFNHRAVSPAGASGLMQLMPETARELGVQNIFDIKDNIGGGARYLRQMLDQFGGNVHQALMAYNAGPGTVRRYQGDVPYKETRQYVERVLRFSGLNNQSQTIT